MSPVAQKPIIHGRDHGCGGADPIPGICDVVSVTGTIEETILATGPGAYYKLEEGSGDWADSADARPMGYVSRTGTVRAVASGYDEGDGELCVTVDGPTPAAGLSGNFIGQTSDTWFAFAGVTGMTVSARVKLNSLPGGTFSMGVCGTINRDLSGSNAGWGLFLLSQLTGGTAAGKPSFRRYNTVGGMDEVRGAAALAVDSWYRLTASFDGSTLSLYVDDTLVDSDTPGTPVSLPSGSGSAGALLIGAQGIDEGIGTMAPLDAELDSVIVWDRALSPGELGGIVDATPGGIAPEAGQVPTSDGAGHTLWAAPTLEVEY